MNARVKLTAIDTDGNATCSGMDDVVEMDGISEADCMAGAKADWVVHWYGDEQVRNGRIDVAAEIVETW